MGEIKKMIRDVLTGLDNKTYDGARISFVFSMIFLSVMVFIDFLINKHFSGTTYAASIAGITTSHGGMIKLKETTEPQP
jgi:hypothetical protein